MKKILLTSALAITLCILNPLFAQNKADNKTTKADSLNSYDKLLKEKHEIARGMFILHKVKGKLFFEIPLTMFGRELLIGSTITMTSDIGNGITGSKPDPIHAIFSRSGENVQLRRMNSDVVTDNQNSPIAKAIERSNIGSIMRNMKIEAWNKDSSAVVIDMTPFFTGDNKDLSPFDKYSQYTSFNNYKRTETFVQDKSFLESIKAFSDNIVVSSTLSYTYTLTNQTTNKTVVKDQPFTTVVSRSFVLLPEVPAEPRFADHRVAVFFTGKHLFSENEQQARTIYYANRWNLTPKDKEAYKAGVLTEPIKPITFYIDNNFPEKWRPFIKEGVEQWNELFQEIGFKNAIRALDFPADDPEFDPDNIKYSCIRYAPIGIENAMGPSWVDPRSGEIINASVYVYHDIIKLLNNWMFVQISPANKRIRTKNIPEDIISDGLRYVISHEVGHCLGFMHNMSASSVIPVDSLRSPSYTSQYGTTSSIMDYARFNYVAQPGDMEIGVKLTPPRFGEYDRFLIKWTYQYYPDIKNAREEADMLSKMVSEAIKEPIYRYGKQLSYPLDPRSQTEDLGDDAIKASEYGIKNLKYLMEHLNSWVAKEDEDFSYRDNIYDAIVFQYVRYINHVFANVGGVYLNEVKVGDDLPPFESVERTKQKAALQFVMRQIDDLDWLENEALIKNLTIMGSAKELVQTVIAKALIQAPSKTRLSSSISKEPYDFFECSEDLYQFVWGGSIAKRDLSKIEKFMQREYINTTLTSGNISKLITGSNFVINAVSAINRRTLFDILKEEDIDGRFLRLNIIESLNNTERTSAFNPTAGYGVPSTKFNILLNPESDYFIYISRTKKLLESMLKSRVSKEDKLHYELLLKKINSTLKVE